MPDLPGTSRYIAAHPWRYLFIQTAVVMLIVVVLFVLVGDGPWWLPLVMGPLAFLAEAVSDSKDAVPRTDPLPAGRSIQLP